MKQKIYITPELQLCDLEIEAVLCASSEQSFNSLQDYNPTEGAW